MEYSKISTVELINFMSFKKAKVAFDETGIINIKGYNDSGKSAVLRGLVVCLMDMWKTNQKKFIRHGEEYFRIVVTFEDGVSILRDKYINGQSLYEVYKHGERIFTTKQGNKLSKIDGVPQQIQDYLGLCVTDSVYLNYQSCVDKLPVVDTTGSENYQMFHEVLRMEEIYRANNMINTDKNELNARIAEIELGIQRDEVLLERCGDVSEEFIAELEKLDKDSEYTGSKQKYLGGIKEVVDRYDGIQLLPEVSKVETKRLERVYEVKGLVDSLDNVVSYPEVSKINTDRVKKLQVIGSAVQNIENFVSIPEVPRVSPELIGKMSDLQSTVKLFKEYSKQTVECARVDAKLKGCEEELNSLVEMAKKQGMEFTKCENCGSYTLVGGGHVHGL